MMDDLDTHSNLSDGSQSNLSALSGLTGYESELSTIKQYINDETVEKPYKLSKELKSEVLVYENEIKNLKAELQNCLEQNGKYKSEIFYLENKAELMCHGAFEKLAHDKAQIKAEPENANNYIKKLTSQKDNENTNISNVKYFELQHKIIRLEKCNFDLNSTLSLKQAEAKHWKNENFAVRADINKLRSNKKEIQVEINTKLKCVEELKQKVTQQHVAYQLLLQNNSRLNNQINLFKNDLEHSRKSESWYKEQLNVSQSEREKYLKDCLDMKSITIQKDLLVENLKLEVEKLKNKFTFAESNFIKEKEELLKKIDVVNIEIANLSLNYETKSNNVCATSNDAMKMTYETTIQELGKEISVVKNNFAELQLLLQNTTKTNAELMMQNTLLNKSLTEKMLIVENLEKSRQNLQIQLEVSEKKLKKVSDELLSLKYSKNKLEIALSLADEERGEVEDAIKHIKDKFNKFLIVHKSTKEELARFNKEHLKLQTEKQQLFMNTNWQLCEIEEGKKKEIEASQHIKRLSEENSKLIYETYSLKSMNNNLKREIDESNVSKQEKNKGTIENYKLSLAELETESNQYQNDSKQLLQTICQNNTDQCSNCDRNLVEILTYLLNMLVNFEQQMFSNSSITSYCFQYRIECSHLKIFNSLDEQLSRISKHLQKTSEKLIKLEKINTRLKTKNRNVKNKLLREMEKLQVKTSEIEMNTKNSQDLLQICIKNGITEGSLNNVGGYLEEIQNLKTMLKVNDLEQKEREKRYTINNRTLLRKIKEHIRDRNIAEKQNTALQQLYLSVFEELNSSKLAFNNNEYEKDHFRNKLNNVETVNKRLRESVVNLEEKLTNALMGNVTCHKCIEFDEVSSKLIGVLEELEGNTVQLSFYDKELKESNSVSAHLKNQLQEATHDATKQLEIINKVQGEKEALHKLIEQTENDSIDLKSQLEIQESRNEKLRIKHLVQIEEHSNCNSEICNLKICLQDANERSEILYSEINILKLALNGKSDELASVRKQNSSVIDCLNQNYRNSENSLFKLKTQIENHQADLNLLRDEKYFLRRLNSDLKIALETMVKQKKVTNQRIHALGCKDEGFVSMPNSFSLPSPTKFDDTKIMQLLQQCSQNKPLGDLHNCLNLLKKEMVMLQEQISQKTFVS